MPSLTCYLFTGVNFLGFIFIYLNHNLLIKVYNVCICKSACFIEICYFTIEWSLTFCMMMMTMTMLMYKQNMICRIHYKSHYRLSHPNTLSRIYLLEFIEPTSTQLNYKSKMKVDWMNHNYDVVCVVGIVMWREKNIYTHQHHFRYYYSIHTLDICMYAVPMSLCKVWSKYLGVVSNYNDDAAKDDDDVDDYNIVIKNTYVISFSYLVNNIYMYTVYGLSHFHPHEWWLFTRLRSASDKWKYCVHTRHSSPVRVGRQTMCNGIMRKSSWT